MGRKQGKQVQLGGAWLASSLGSHAKWAASPRQASHRARPGQAAWRKRFVLQKGQLYSIIVGGSTLSHLWHLLKGVLSVGAPRDGP